MTRRIMWVMEGHKYACAKKDVPRHAVSGKSLEDVQAAIDSANTGDIITLTEGSYRWKKKSGRPLTISKPIRLWGPAVGGKESRGVILHCDLTIDEKVSNHGSVTVANLAVMGSIKVESNSYDGITFSRVKMEQSSTTADGAMVHIMRTGICLFFACELIGGDEALYIDGIDDLSHSKEPNENKVHIKRTTIRNGGKRGICADDKFILEKSIIKDNGWYGIRSNRGWTDKGGNNWQRNPTKPNQTPTSGNGMFDGIQVPSSSGNVMIGGRQIPINFSHSTGDTSFPGFGQNARQM
ncbi:hypothetical protein ACHAXR_008008 [Thalassiosira sp. AJA248-18]